MANSPIVDGKFGIRVYFSGQIGNQFFHYCLGKILAEQRGQLFAPPPEFVDSKGDPVVWSGQPFFIMRPTPGIDYQEHLCVQFGARYWYDFDSLPKDRPIHICYGHWCRYELYKAWKQKIRTEWLSIPPDRFVTTDPEAVYIHVRLTDFKVDANTAKTYGSTTPIENVVACLEQFSDFKRLVIVTDDANDPFHHEFRRLRWPTEICCGPWDQDFLLLASCRQMIMSNSTFSWWAGFLGKPERIVCPLRPGTMWSLGQQPGADREANIDLFVDDEPGRWSFVEVPHE